MYYTNGEILIFSQQRVCLSNFLEFRLFF